MKHCEMNNMHGAAKEYERFVTSPTEAEVSSLGTNSQKSEESPPSLTEVLTEVFEICRHRWVFDFLFNDNVTPLSSLTAPINMNAAVSSTYQMTSVEHTDRNQPRFASGGMFDLHMAGDIFFVPSFSVGAITVGFGVQRMSMLGRLEWGLDHNFNGQHDSITKLHDLDHFRFVRDDERQSLLVTHEDLKSDILRLDMGRLVRTMQRQRRLVCFYLSAFRNVINRMVSTCQMVHLSKPFVFMCVSATDYRPCPFCNALQHVSPCACSFSKAHPSHPLDFAVTRTNMERHLGTFQGVSVARYCVNGVPVMSAKLANRLSISRATEGDLIDRLSRWAISDKLKSNNFNLVHYTMPRANSLVGSLDSVDNQSDVTKTASIPNDELNALMPATTSVGKPPPLHSQQHYSPPSSQFCYRDPQKTEQAVYHAKNITQNINRPSFVHGDTNEWDFRNQPDDRKSPEGPSSKQPLHIGVNLSTSDENDEDVSEDEFEDAQENMQDHATSNHYINHYPLQTNDMRHGNDGPERNNEKLLFGRQERYRKEDQRVSTHNDLTGRLSVDAESTLRQLRGQRNGAPPPQFQDAMTAGQGSVGGATFLNEELTEKEMERHRRAELRRQRNREAAQRSNLRRKIKNDTLKRELNETHAKAAELRARELALREENLQLRKVLASK